MGGDGGPKTGKGPSKEEREAGLNDMVYVGSDEEGNTIKVAVTGNRELGYGSTSKIITEASICLVNDTKDTQGGIWTSDPAMGDKLIKRLVANARLTFTQE